MSRIHGEVSVGPDPDFGREALLALPPDARAAVLLAGLRREAARALRVPVSRVGAEEPLTALGLDSLAAVELQQVVESALGIAVPLAGLLDGVSIAGLGREVLGRLDSGTGEPVSVPLAPETDELPLSHGQQALWFLARLAPESGAYHIAAAARVRPSVDAAALCRALDALARRHHVLRTTFHERGGEPRQRVHPDLRPAVQEEDASAWSEAELAARLAREANRPFDLASGPLLRLGLFRRSAGEDTLLLTVHHIIADFASLAILVRELAALYGHDSPPPLPDLPLTYGDYACWQRERMAGPEGEALWEHWRQRLAGPLPVLALPTDRPRPPVPGYRGRVESLLLAPEASGEVAALARSAGATLFTTVLGAFQALLCRYTGQQDLLVGTPTAGRNRAELAGVMGYFVNPVVLRADLAGDPSGAELLARTRQAVLAAFAHQDYPFPLLAERLQPERDLSRSPLFQVLFVLHRGRTPEERGLAAFALGEAGERLELGPLTLESQRLDEPPAQFDLTLRAAELERGLALSLEFDADLFDAVTARRSLGHLRNLLLAMAGDPRRRLSELPLLAESERHQLLAEWNGTAADLPAEICLHRWVEARVARSPEAVAVACEDRELTYAELDARAGRLARRLRRLGVAPDQPVAICLERSLELVVGLLAILKAGAAYAPLDPSYPQERLEFMLDDALRGAARPVLLTGPELAGRFAGSDVLVVLAGAGREAAAGDRDRKPCPEVSPDHLAYVIYTSGSTGRPKGVMNTHRGIVNRLLWMQQTDGLTARDRVLQKTPISFDVSVWELFWPLLTGARLVLARPEGHRDNAYLAELIAGQEITTAHFVPSMLQAFLEEPRIERCRTLARVMASGEALPLAAEQRLAERLPWAVLHNLYGPTEAAVEVTFWACAPGAARQSVPIGRPVANTRIHLLDATLSPVPVGVPGELYIGGVQLARGYHRRPALTAERFLPDPLGEPGARLYRSGDVARHLPGGEIEYLGRTDQQVKIRGFRVEPGEIEAVLREHPAVREAAVALREDGAGERWLLACVVPEVEPPAVEDLRRLLAARLPAPMVPGAFAFLERLPLAPSGKLDRKALAQVVPLLHGAETAGRPRTPVEELLAQQIARLLRVESVALEDNFFHLGGHSLLATRLVSRLRAACGVELPVRAVFEAPVVADLAAVVEGAMRARQEALPPIERAAPEDRDAPPPLSYAQQRLWLLDRLEPGNPAYNIPAAVRWRGPLDAAVLAATLQEIARRHETLRTVFAEVAGKPVQGILPSTPVPLPTLDLQGLPGPRRQPELDRLRGEEARRPFDLASGPLFRGTVVTLDVAEHALLLTLHHVVGDGWSLGVLVRELGSLYQAYREGRPSPLPALPVQYADFARWQRRWLTGECLEGELSHWRERLRGMPPVLELPADRPRPAVQTFRGARCELALPARLAGELRALARERAATLFMTVLAAFQGLLARHSGQDDFAVGTPISGRNQVAIEDLVGFFVNLLVLRADLSGDPGFADLLERTRQTTLAAYTHQDLPFEKLVEEENQERALDRTPLFQVAFVLENAPLAMPVIPGVDLERLPADGSTAKFDLTASFEDGGGGLSYAFEYNRDLFHRATIERLARHFEVLLEALVEDPRRRLSELPLLTEAERLQATGEWNDTGKAVSQVPLVHERFAAHAAARPQQTAVASSRGRLTYGELEARANRLAHHLRSLGVGPEVLVAICTERTLERLVGIVAVLKAGGAYVSLDPTYPRERLAFLLADARAPVILTEQRFRDTLPDSPAQVLSLDADWQEIRGREDRPPSGGACPDNLAYVVYTSGSTGRPKGVEIPHAGLTNLVRWHQDLYGVSPADRGTQVASPAFDASIWELWPYLAAGASLHIPDEDVRFSPAGMVRWWSTEGITLAYLMTPLAEGVLEEEIPRGLELAVRALIIGGDRLHRGPRPGTAFRLMNHYGPAEYTVTSTVVEVPPEGEGRGAPTIGRPIDNTRVYVLDRHLQQVPTGVDGELFVAGTGMGRGYLRRPEMTAERFLPDPWSAAPGERMYRTGDLVRYLPDGDVDFLGRIDHQVKLRGLRIELGEIELVLAQHPGLREAVVLVREDRPGDRRLIAYAVTAGEPPPAADELRAFLHDRLPDYMVPAAFLFLDALPLTPNGKVDRRALPAPLPAQEAAYATPAGLMEEALAGIWGALLRVERVGRDDSFFELGGHSLLMIRLRDEVQRRFGRSFSMVEMFRYPTLRAMAGYLGDAGEAPSPAPRESEAEREAVPRESGPATEIAVIGMAGRFPGADDVEAFWRNLASGAESISFFSDEELLEAGAGADLLGDPRYVRARGVLAGADRFDAELFGYNPREAELMDPQQRLFLESAWAALEDAGYPPRGPRRGPVGVFGGAALSSYLLHLLAQPDLASAVGEQALVLANGNDFLCTRVSYKLNLEGPSFVVQTACSTSLVAVHLACQALLRGECDMALAGGVSVRFPQTAGYLHQQGGILSPDGHCRAFDAGAQGTVPGGGVGIVVLKRLADAVADGDAVRAVIKGSAINNDGASKAGYTAPREESQARVIRAAQRRAGVEPGTISYVEAHGTGTELGDPIEIAALTRAFHAGTDALGFCAVGAVKANVGHLDAAAGVAGLIKTVLALERKVLPGSLHFAAPNPEIDFANSPFYVSAEARPWPAGPGPRRAGVSSFGIGGTNAHVVLEEASARRADGVTASARPWQLLPLSARTEEALTTAAANLAAHLKDHPELDPGDIAWTCQVGRSRLEHRRALVIHGLPDAVRVLTGGDAGRVWTASGPVGTPPLAFLFSGLGDQYAGMGAGLYRTEPAFRGALDRCAELLLPDLGLDIRTLLYPGRGQKINGEELPALESPGLDLRRLLKGRPAAQDDAAAQDLDRTLFLQPTLFAVEYALAQMWRAWGIEPQAMIGYSLGEYVAACLAGVLSLESALTLVAGRARLIDGLPEGAMLAVPLPEGEAMPHLGEELSLAAINGPSLSVVAGPPDAVAGLERHLRATGLACRRLRTSHAFHSACMGSISGRFRELVRTIDLAPPEIPYVSNVTGTWIEASQATDPDYWVEHLRLPVRFAQGVGELWREPGRILLEVGPGQSLGSLAVQNAPAGAGPVLASLRHEHDGQPDERFALATLAQLWLSGAVVDWAGVHAGASPHRVPLPTYPFERRRFWIGGAGRPHPAATPPAPAIMAAAEAKRPLDEWTYVPVWQQGVPLPPPAAPEAGPWLLFLDEGGLGRELGALLRARGASVATAEIGVGFERSAPGSYRLAPADPEGYRALLAGLAGEGARPRRIVHLWTTGAPGRPLPWGEPRARGFYSLLGLARALAEAGDGPVDLAVVSSRLHDVLGGEDLEPETATVLGPVKVISQELPHVRCRSIDAGDWAGASPPPARVEALLAELCRSPAAAGDPAGLAEPVVAYRGTHRFVRAFAPVALAAGAPPPLRRGGVYLITGGLGRLGLVLARHLAEKAGARLVLTGRSTLPPRESWPERMAAAADDPLARTLRAVAEIEALGSPVLALAADVTDREAMAQAVATARQRFGAIHGVIHAAGTYGLNPIQQKSAGEAARVLAPKVEGGRVLAELFRDGGLDFLLLFSSLSSLAGGLGLADYAAANAFLDALAHRETHHGGPRTVAIDWGPWQPAADGPEQQGRLDRLGRRARELFAAGMRPEEGLEVMARVLASSLPQVVVSPRELSRELQAVEQLRREEAESRPVAGGRRPALLTRYVAPRDAVEQELAGMWGALLGIGQVGVHDNFFQLGGHSLLAVQVLSRVRDGLGCEMQLDELLARPTVAELAAAVMARQAEGLDADLAAMVADVQQLSSEELQGLLAAEALDGLAES